VGAACAWQLQRAGYRCTVIDSGEATDAASWGNAGHLAIEQIDPLASFANLRSLPRRLFTWGGPVGLPLRQAHAWLPFGIRLMAASTPQRFARGRRVLSSLLAEAMPAWHRLVAQTGTDQYLRVDGHFVAWETPHTASAGRRHWLHADIGKARVQSATPGELALLKTHFNQRPVDALRFHNTGQILDLPKMREGVLQALSQQGARVEKITARALESRDGKAAVRLADGALLHADRVVVAAGIGSPSLLRAFEGSIPLIAERGYHLDAAHTSASAGGDLAPVAFEDRSVIVTRFASTARIAGFTEFSQDRAKPDARKWQRLAHHARELGVPMGQDPAAWVGSRPTLPDYLPAIGKSQRASNVVYAFGHQHLGVTLAALTGELVASLACDADPAVDLRPLHLDRFQ
jgi:glycine/D-amino acid oxidase-like deaminating enzyme